MHLVGTSILKNSQVFSYISVIVKYCSTILGIVMLVEWKQVQNSCMGKTGNGNKIFMGNLPGI